jgi:hypothetical protein
MARIGAVVVAPTRRRWAYTPFLKLAGSRSIRPPANASYGRGRHPAYSAICAGARRLRRPRHGIRGDPRHAAVPLSIRAFGPFT